jgi:hypothetical protein
MEVSRKEPAAMTSVQIIEGTIAEITTRLHQTYADQERARVFVETEEEDLSADLPDPPNAVRDREHLFQLLEEGLNGLDDGQGIEVTPAYWEGLRNALKERATRWNSS